MRKYKKILEEEHKVDIVVPLCHLYVPQVYKPIHSDINFSKIPIQSEEKYISLPTSFPPSSSSSSSSFPLPHNHHHHNQQDLVTCKEFDFPVVLSGHDHHTVNEVHDDTLLLKGREGKEGKKGKEGKEGIFFWKSTYFLFLFFHPLFLSFSLSLSSGF